MSKEKEYLDGWKRARADLINFRQQEAQRLAEASFNYKKEILGELLLLLDEFQRAEDNAPPNEETKGFIMIGKMLEKILKNQGVEPMITENTPFDPSLHEAVEMVEGKDSGLIAQEISKGYLLDGRLLRPAKVKVNK
jgi:molecular chaperone GrpE